MCRYPAPKEATHKVRGRSDVLELVCGAGAVDPELLTVKTFYFFFYSAFGSLFPLMGVYFKQMGMNAGQCGLLIGTRPFVEFLSAPFWGGLADRWRKGRALLLASLGAWIVFTLPLSWVQPAAVACVAPLNDTAYRLEPPRYDDDWPAAPRHFRGPAARVGSPLPVDDAVNYRPDAERDWVTPLHSYIVYSTPDIQKTFFLLLLLVVIGEFFSAPAITLADSAVITLLGEDADRYAPPAAPPAPLAAHRSPLVPRSAGTATSACSARWAGGWRCSSWASRWTTARPSARTRAAARCASRRTTPSASLPSPCSWAARSSPPRR